MMTPVISGLAAKDYVGLAVASYEWIAAITLVVVAFFFLPKFLRSGIYTIPEYLEYRYTHHARAIMSLLMVITLVCVNITVVIYLGAMALEPLFEGTVLPEYTIQLGQSALVIGGEIDIVLLSWVVGIAAAVYVAIGGLKACAWTDLFWGSSLIIGGFIIMVLTFMALDKPNEFAGVENAEVCKSIGVEEDASVTEKFSALKEQKMHMVLSADNPEIPWTALILGIWIPNFYYWGLNQYIMQRTLGARSLADGQRGVVFAAALKLVIPFIVCIPGIIAFSLYHSTLQEKASEKNNKDTLVAFDEAQSQPKDSGKLFTFNGDFEKLYPDSSKEILAFNAKAAGVNVPSGDTLATLNSDLVKEAAKNNDKLEVQTELVGYDYDSAFPTLVNNLAPVGLKGFLLAALMGAVVSSLAAMLNAASTIFTMDVYREYIHKTASQGVLVLVGRCCVPIAVLVGCIVAPALADPRYQGAFHFIQEFQGYISPGILTVFLFGLFVPKTPRICGVVGLVLCPFIYGALHNFAPDIAFLNRMAITVGALAVVLGVMTAINPLKEPVKLPEQSDFDMTSSKGAKIAGIVVVVVTVALYIIFW
jgi:SSS family solute:Na+ symporter